jgi:endonuclease/exonuclease/phosphatase family metal-dependent hydrolase
MFYTFDNFLRRLRRKFSLNEWAIRHLRLPIPEDAKPEKPGLLMIQIDGLARTQFEKAIKRKRLPFLRSLIRHQHYNLHTFYSGLPATTPAVQGEIFYGVRCAVPAFTFLNRPAKRLATMYNPDSVKPVEARLQQQGEPLLQGGSSWSNIYTGGATQAESHMCAASIGLGDVLRSKSLFGFLGTILVQIPTLLRIFFLFVLEFFIAAWDVVEQLFKRPKNIFKEIRFVLNRMFISIGLREFITLGASIDLARGLPVVHVNFLGYDEQAHRRGPGSAFAHWSLRGIDEAVRKLYFAARHSHRRDYQVWIYSDHGQETARAYSEIFPGGIEQAIRACLEHFAISAGVQVSACAEDKLNPELQRSSARRYHVSRAYWAGGRIAQRRYKERSLWEQLTKEEEESFSVTAMGPVGHVYFFQEFNLEQKTKMAEWLVHHAKVPGVLLRIAPGEMKWIRANGSFDLPGNGAKLFPHNDSLKSEIVSDLVCLCENEFAGDLILLGWSPDHAAITFEEERGAHGGPGLEETRGFALLPENTRLPHSENDCLRGTTLRDAALHRLRRKSLQRRSSKTSVPHLRVMTYNVHSCLGMDGKISTHRIAQVIERYDPLIVGLQELDALRPRSRGEEQAELIARELGMHVSYFPVFKPGPELYGDAVFSRFPIEVVRAAPLATDSPEREPRGAIWLRVQFNGIKINFINTHFGLGRFERVAQAADLMSKDWIGGIELDEPIILCGDFNTFPNTFPYRTLVSRLHDVQIAMKNFRPRKTFSVVSPIFRIDHIFISGHFKVHRIQVPRNHLTRLASDHLPLIADLDFEPRINDQLRAAPRISPLEFVANEVN